MFMPPLASVTAQKNPASRDNIVSLLRENDLGEPSLVRMLDYVIELFENNGMGKDYYGYHNIDHELAVTYVTLLSACSAQNKMGFTKSDIRHMYAAALFHDFDPLKVVDKPHEMSVLSFIVDNKDILKMMREADIDLDIVKALILRTTYPWSGTAKENALSQIDECFASCDMTKNDTQAQKHFMNLGRYLSVVDRIGGYTLGDFTHAMELAKMNAHALAWRPSLIVRKSVAYFEDLQDSEPQMCRNVLASIPYALRKNFFDTILSFLQIRGKEISIQAEYTYDNLQFVPTIETMYTRNDSDFIDTLKYIFAELPKPLQFGPDTFEKSIRDPETILNTLRLNDCTGKILGFAKGGPLENYTLDSRINDRNFGMHNTVFLEPLALRMGYWGLRGGQQMRHLFVMQAHSKMFKFLSSFALRDVIQSRVDKEMAEFVAKFDPERWDYYRLKL